MERPRQEQIKEFWEWWGFKKILGIEWWYYERLKATNHWWEAPTGRRYKNLPSVDLNNLFEYAVPKVNETHSIYLHIGKTLTTCVLSPYFNHPREQVNEQHQDKDPALALFWALYSLIKKGD